MDLLIGDNRYDIFESITHATLGTLRDMEKQSTARGTLVTVNILRTYLIEDVIQSTVNFGFCDSDAKLTKLGCLIFLCRRHAGEPATVADSDDVVLADIRVTFETDESGADPKEQTGSDPAGNTETPA